jgi:hypothetical protein
MPYTQLVLLVGALVVLMIPLIALEWFSDYYPHVQEYKASISIVLWIAILAIVYFLVVPWLELA